MKLFMLKNVKCYPLRVHVYFNRYENNLKINAQTFFYPKNNGYI